MKFNPKFLIEAYELPYENVVEKTFVGKDRWSAEYRIVFKHEGKFYQTTYREGLTEYQDEELWPVTELDCPEVHQVEKVVRVWERISEQS
jgi:hypothetical protein